MKTIERIQTGPWLTQLFPGDTVTLHGKKYKIINIGKGHMIGRVKLRRYLRYYLWIPNEDVLERWKEVK